MVVLYSYFDSKINIVGDFDVPLYYSINMKLMINRVNINIGYTNIDYVLITIV